MQDTQKTKLHISGLCKAMSGTLCRCGHCSHLVLKASRKLGLTPAAVWASLGYTAKAKTVNKPTPRPLTLGSVAARAKVIGKDGNMVEGPSAVLSIIAAMGGLT